MPDTAQNDGPEKIVYQGRIIEVVEQPVKVGGKALRFEFARRSPGTRLIIVDSKAKKVLLTKEYRHELSGYDYRLPGGKVFDSLEAYNQFLATGKDIIEPATERAVIEAREETGIIANNPKHFYTSINGTTVVWDLFYFVIDDWEQSTQELDGEGENIEVMWVSFTDAREHALNHMAEDRSTAVLLRWLDKQ